MAEFQNLNFNQVGNMNGPSSVSSVSSGIDAGDGYQDQYPPDQPTTAQDPRSNFYQNGKPKPGLIRKLFRLKNIDRLQDTEENTDDSELKACTILTCTPGYNILRKVITYTFQKVLGTRDLVSLGIGSCMGTGMYLVSGIVAKKVAGPAVVLSYTVAGLAALMSGFCYAELGARVPHTTGSAYVYSYVTVGEFVAFIIGWNMILEYIIGTASCACALSACIDILSNSAISNITSAWAGEVWESPPDVLAFLITLAMMVVFFQGVRRSVIFNNVLNIINLASLLIIIGVGLWFTKVIV